MRYEGREGGFAGGGVREEEIRDEGGEIREERCGRRDEGGGVKY